jgi:hypothetical protein
MSSASHPDGPFLAMQLLEGQTVAHSIAAQGQLEFREIVRVALQVASGMETAHNRGIYPSGHQAGGYLPDVGRPGKDPRFRL